MRSLARGMGFKSVHRDGASVEIVLPIATTSEDSPTPASVHLLRSTVTTWHRPPEATMSWRSDVPS